MNIENEIEWNSHIIKSGRVLGTYEWMMSKGYDLHEINYVVWDTIDNTWEPLAKAIGKATQQHPDILLKNAMRDAIQQEQATQFQQRMRENPMAKPTGTDYRVAGQPMMAAYAGLRNLASGGAYSNPQPKLDQQAPSGSGKRFGMLSAMRRPGVAVSSALGARKANKDHARLSSKVAANDLAMSRLLAGRDPSELSPKELERYKNMERIKQDAEGNLESLDTRGFQARAQDASNKKIQDKRPNAALGELPFPAREATRGDPAQMVPVEDTTPTGEEADPEVDEAVQGVGAAAQRAAEGPATGTPAETGAKPEASPAIDTTDPKAFSQALGYTRFKPEGKAGDLFRRLTEAKGSGSPIDQTIERARISMGRGRKLTQEMFDKVVSDFGFTPELFAQLPKEQQKEVLRTVKDKVENPPAETPPAEPAPAEPETPEPETPEEPTEFVAEPPATEEEEEILEDSEELITSKDTLESLNMAFTFLKSRR